MELREYQKKTIATLLEWFGRNETGNPIVSASVGAGKSVLIAHLCEWALTEFPGERIVMIVASKELCEQNYEKLVTVWPEAPVGILSASIGGKRTADDIIFGTIGTVFRNVHSLGKRSLVIVDECHNINPANTGMYRKTIEALKLYNPDLRVIGWTGTPFRGNGVWLTEGEEPLFTDIAAHIGMTELVEQGFLSPLRNLPVETLIKADGTRTSGDDYVVSELARLADRQDVTHRAVDTIVEKGADRKGWLIYCVTIAHAEHVLDEIRSRGIKAELITGETPKKERETILRRFKAGEVRCIVNVVVLTVGFDAPHVDLIALLRPTKSKVMYVQIAGRGMRIEDGKTDCLWLDFTDTTLNQGPVNLIKGRKKREGGAGGGMPEKQCHECGALNPIGARNCQVCDAVFEQDIKIAARASIAPIMTLPKEYVPAVYPVSNVTYSVHQKEGKPPSMCVAYYSGLRYVAKEWVCFEHGGFIQQKAAAWWSKRLTGDVPATTAEAVKIANSGALKEPKFISLDERPQYPEIKGLHINDPRLKVAA